MPQYRILYMPWPLDDVPRRSAGQEYAEKNEGWINKYVLDDPSHAEMYQVWYRPGGQPSPLMGSLQAGDQVYIRGHSLAGVACIYSKDARLTILQTPNDQVRSALLETKRELNSTDSRGAECLTPKEVATRLLASGLQPSFAGAIKCYNCYSGENEHSFAQAFADHMYNSCGFRSCTFYGYKGALSSWYDGAHKSSTAGGRASSQRVQITPH